MVTAPNVAAQDAPPAEQVPASVLPDAPWETAPAAAPIDLSAPPLNLEIDNTALDLTTIEPFVWESRPVPTAEIELVDVGSHTGALQTVDPVTGHIFYSAAGYHYVHESDGAYIRRLGRFGGTPRFDGDYFYVPVPADNQHGLLLRQYERESTIYVRTWDLGEISTQAITVAGGSAWFFHSGRLGRLDIATGALELELRFLAGAPFVSMHAEGDNLFVGAGENYLVDISDPSQPEVTTIDGESWQWRLNAGGLWFLSTDGGLEARNIADPSAVLDTFVLDPEPHGVAELDELVHIDADGMMFFEFYDDRTGKGLAAFDPETEAFVGTIGRGIARGEIVETPDGYRALTARRSGSGFQSKTYLVFTNLGPSLMATDARLLRADLPIANVTLWGAHLEDVERVTFDDRTVAFEYDNTTSEIVATAGPTASPVTTITASAGIFWTSLEIASTPPPGYNVVTFGPELVGPADGPYEFQGRCFRDESPDYRFDDVEVAIGAVKAIVIPPFYECRVQQTRGDDEAQGALRPSPLTNGVGVHGAQVVFSTVGDNHVVFYNEHSPAFTNWVFVVTTGGPPVAPDQFIVEVDCPIGATVNLAIDGGFGLPFASPEYQESCDFTLSGHGSNEVTSFRSNTPVSGPERSERAAWHAPALVFVVDYGGSDFDDPVVIGVPNEAIGSKRDAGLVHIVPTTWGGDPTGPGSIAVRQGRRGTSGSSESGDLFGASSAIGNFNGDLFLDVAIGVPGEGLDGKDDVGAVQILYGSPTGFTSGHRTWLTQSTPGIPGVREGDDRFGSALSAFDADGDGFDDLAIGVPGEDIGSIRDAGIVQLVFGSSSGLSGAGATTFRQGRDGIRGAIEAGDQFGYAVDGHDGVLAVGAPGEDIGKRVDQGHIVVIDMLRGDVISVGMLDGTVARGAAGDELGTSVVLVGQEVVGGAPGRVVGGETDAGAAVIRRWLNEDRNFEEDSLIVTLDDFDSRLTPTQGDRFGASLAVQPGSEQTLIGVPGANNGQGLVAAQLTPAGNRGWFDQGTPGVPGALEAGDNFGGAVAFSPGGSWIVAAPAEDTRRVDAGYVLVFAENATGFHQGTSGVAGVRETGDKLGSSLGAS